MELISIITPAHNAGKHLEDTILSVMDQTFQSWELIVINDGSTDNTPIIAELYALKDSRIKLVNQNNQGPGAARNTGIENSSGNWIAFLDSDDLWHHSKLEKQLLFSQKFPDVDVFFSSGWKFNDINNLDDYNTLTGKFDAERMYRLEFKDNYIPTLSVMVKRAMVSKIGFMKEGVCEDWDYWLRMALCGAKFYGIDDKLFFYRRHPANITRDTINLRLFQMKTWISNYRCELFKKNETRHIFIPLVNSLLIDLIASDRKTEAYQVASSVSKVLPLFSMPYRLLIQISNQKSIQIFSLINRVFIKIKTTLKLSKFNP